MEVIICLSFRMEYAFSTVSLESRYSSLKLLMEGIFWSMFSFPTEILWMMESTICRYLGIRDWPSISTYLKIFMVLVLGIGKVTNSFKLMHSIFFYPRRVHTVQYRIQT